MAGRGAQEFDSLEGLLGHKPKSGGGNFLKGWKKKPGHIDTWMHTKRLPMALWRHTFPVPVLSKDKDSGETVKHIYTKKFTCHETEEVLGHPWREKLSGERENMAQLLAAPHGDAPLERNFLHRALAKAGHR